MQQETKIQVAMDSGAVRTVANPSVIPAGVKVTPDTLGKHFYEAGREVIKQYGECCTLMTGQKIKSALSLEPCQHEPAASLREPDHGAL